jgi:hypothetical protein
LLDDKQCGFVNQEIDARDNFARVAATKIAPLIEAMDTCLLKRYVGLFTS